jgi:hypothetical protein
MFIAARQEIYSTVCLAPVTGHLPRGNSALVRGAAPLFDVHDTTTMTAK